MPSGFDVSWRFDERLRDVPNDPAAMRRALAALRERAARCDDGVERARLLGEAGGYARALGQPATARTLLTAAVVHARVAGRRRLEAVLQIRLAHALHWAGLYRASDALFDEVLARCAREPELDGLADFAHQHYGKSLLDQHRTAEAVEHLERALALRRRKGDPELLDSTVRALELARAAERAGRTHR